MIEPHEKLSESKTPLFFSANVLVLCGQIAVIWGISRWIRSHEKNNRQR